MGVFHELSGLGSQFRRRPKRAVPVRNQAAPASGLAGRALWELGIGVGVALLLLASSFLPGSRPIQVLTPANPVQAQETGPAESRPAERLGILRLASNMPAVDPMVA